MLTEIEASSSSLSGFHVPHVAGPNSCCTCSLTSWLELLWLRWWCLRACPMPSLPVCSPHACPLLQQCMPCCSLCSAVHSHHEALSHGQYGLGRRLCVALFPGPSGLGRRAVNDICHTLVSTSTNMLADIPATSNGLDCVPLMQVCHLCMGCMAPLCQVRSNHVSCM